MLKALLFIGLLSTQAQAQTASLLVPKHWSASLWGDTASSPAQDLGTHSIGGSSTRGMGLTLRHMLGERVVFGINLGAWSRELGGSTASASVQALAPGLRAGWLLAQRSRWALLAEAEAAWWRLNNAILRDAQGGALGSLEGQGPGGALQASLLLAGLPSLAVELQGGWRLARLSGVSFAPDAGAGLPAVGDLSVDLGGPYLRAGVTILWGLQDPWDGMGGEAAQPEHAPDEPAPQPETADPPGAGPRQIP